MAVGTSESSYTVRQEGDRKKEWERMSCLCLENFLLSLL